MTIFTPRAGFSQGHLVLQEYTHRFGEELKYCVKYKTEKSCKGKSARLKPNTDSERKLLAMLQG
jgi:hypothetical protein